MKIALIGSVSSSWYSLDALVRCGVDVSCVCGVDESRAERIGDYRSLRNLATDAGIPFLSFVKVSEPSVESFLRSHPIDLLWVIGLSQMVPDNIIEIAKIGGVGFHPTMLPEGRGRAPVAWTILLGRRAAVNLFFLTDQPDAGDIIVQREVPVLPDDYSEDLIQRTNEVLADAICELAPNLKAGTISRTPQDHAKATYYEKRTPADGLIDWTSSTDQVYRLIRAAGRPYPGAFTHVDGAALTVWRAKPAVSAANPTLSQPGSVLQSDPQGGMLVKTGDGAIRLTEIASRDDQRAESLIAVGKVLA